MVKDIFNQEISAAPIKDGILHPREMMLTVSGGGTSKKVGLVQNVNVQYFRQLEEHHEISTGNTYLSNAPAIGTLTISKFTGSKSGGIEALLGKTGQGIWLDSSDVTITLTHGSGKYICQGCTVTSYNLTLNASASIVPEDVQLTFKALREA